MKRSSSIGVSIAIALLLAGSAVAQTARDPDSAAPANPLEAFFRGFLLEALDGSYDAARPLYEQAAAASDEGLDAARARSLARGRLLQVAVLRGNRAEVERHRALVNEHRRERAARYLDGRDGAPARDLRAAVQRGDSAALDRCRAALHAAWPDDDSPTPRWVSLAYLFWDRPHAPDPQVSAAAPAHLRLRVALPAPTAAFGELRQRASAIADLRLAGHTDQADRLEADVISRLLQRGGHDALRAREPIPPPAALGALLARIEQLLQSARLSPEEARILRDARARAAALIAAGDSEEARALLDALPYHLSGAPHR